MIKIKYRRYDPDNRTKWYNYNPVTDKQRSIKLDEDGTGTYFFQIEVDGKETNWHAPSIHLSCPGMYNDLDRFIKECGPLVPYTENELQ